MRSLVAILLWIAVKPRPSAARSPPPLPSWDTLPIFFHSSNESGLWNPTAVSRIATFPLVTLEKSQGWNNASDSRPEEARALDAAAQIKAVNPDVSIFYYLNTLISYPFPALAAWLVAHDIYELQNSSLLPARITLSGSLAPYPLFDQAQAPLRAQWLADVAAQVDTGLFDGVFADRAHNLTNWGPEARLSPAQSSAWQAGHRALLALAEAAMAAVNGTALENNRLAPGVQAAMYEDFGASDACIRALRAAADADILVEAHAGDLPGGSDQGCVGITNSLAAFLVGAGRKAYYGCSKSWTTNPAWPAVPDSWLDPRPEYTRPLGLPEGPAVLSGGLWARNFSAGVAVTFDVGAGTGRIVWADGTVEQGSGPADAKASCAWLTN